MPPTFASIVTGSTDLKTRTSFVAEVVAKVRAAVDEDMPIILRLSQWKQLDVSVRLVHSSDEMHDWLMPLVEAGAEDLNLAGWARKITRASTISVGSVGLSGDFAGAFAGGKMTGCWSIPHWRLGVFGVFMRHGIPMRLLLATGSPIAC